MNKSRRNKLDQISGRLEAIKVEIGDITAELKNILIDEENAFESMPEGLQASERGMNSEESIDLMYDIEDCLKKSIEDIDDIINM
jgi:hypothetical protein